jgi:membrane associated rhomboid family serine protease
VIPIRHTLPYQTTPVVNRGLVAANVIVFLAQLMNPRAGEVLIDIFGFMPARLLHPGRFHYAAWEAALTLVTSVFLHGGVVHLIGNMIYLWTFGGAIEDIFGHGKYLVLFIACGAVGSVTHTALLPGSTVPSIGASGSIAGVLGAFLVLRPRARIVTLFPLVVYWAMAEIRAALFLPVWFAMQFLNGFMSLAAAAHTEEVAGIAWWAHVGGFLFGAAVAAVYRMTAKPA